jgi:hypothetical protein
MEVMCGHEWKDPDVERVLFYGHENNREIVLKDGAEAVVINKEDVVALANEFGLFVFDQGSRL